MKTKQEIVGNWLVRYTKQPLESFGEHILLTNFNNYVDMFCDQCGVPRVGYEANMRTVTADGITMINFGMGSPNAALIMDLLSCVQPKACLFLGKCACRYPRRGYVKRLFSARDSRLAGLHVAACRVHSLARQQPRLLDRDGLHDEPPRLGAR